MSDNIVYCVQNVKTKEFFKTISGKMCWRSSGHAKNGWMNPIPHYERPKSFDAQDEWKVVKCKIVPIEEE